MPNEIYHRSEWGNPNPEGWGDIYFDPAATNKLYNHSDYYENSDGTDKILRDIPNKASITLTPTAYSDGSINTVIPPYQVLPQELVTNGNFDTDSDWDLGSAWSIGNGKALYDGSSNGSLIRQYGILTSGKKYKASFNVLDNSGRFRISVDGGSSVYKTYTTGNGYYTFEFTSITSDFRIGASMADNADTFSIDNVSVKEIQEADFDFSRGSSATRVNEKGLIEDVASGIPRIDYTTGFGSWLLEPQRTNLITYSEDFSDASWTASNTSVSSNQTTSPDGSVNADKLTDNATSNVHRIRDAVSLSASTDYSLSVFAKKDTLSNIQLALVNTSNSNTISKVFDLENGIIGEELSQGGTTVSDAKIENFGNGWYRCTIVGQLGSTPNQYQISLATKTTGNSDTLSQVTYSGDGTGSVFLYGAQLEAGSYPTSYIVSNSGSTTTRAAETATNSGNADLFNDSEGVLYAEIAALADDGTNRILGISNGGDFNNSVLLRFSSSSNRIQAQVRLGGVYQCSLNYDVSDAIEFNKIAFKYKQNDFSLYVNGVERATDTTGNVITGLDVLDFDISTTNEFYGKTKELAVFKEALTDAELESLTSWISFTEMATDLEYTLE